MPVVNNMWRPVLVYPVATRTTGLNAMGRGTLLFGFAFIETTGASPAEVDIYDGNDAGGSIAVPVSLTAGQSTREWFGPDGIYFEMGPFLNLVSGSVRGSLFYVDSGPIAQSSPI